MEDKIKFPANVILIDVAFLNEVVYGAKNFLEGKLGRKLPDVDLPAWLSYLAVEVRFQRYERRVVQGHGMSIGGVVFLRQRRAEVL